MATSGTISKDIGTNGVYTLWIDWVRNSQNVTANTSNVTVTLKAKRNDGHPSYGAYNLNTNNTIKLTVGGSVKVNNTSAKIDLRTSTGTTLATWTGDVAHNANGTLSLALEGYFYFNSSAASSLPKGGYTVSGTATLDTIPRKSSVSCTSGNVGESVVVTIGRASSSFTHTLTYSFGSLSGTIATKTSNTNLGWTLPTSFYGQMPSKTKTGTITCETFSGSTSLGTTTCTFTATAVDTVTVSGTVVDSNTTTIALTGDSSKLVKYFSTAKATITASTNNSASISTKTINSTSVSSELSIPNCEATSFVFYAKDSRGYYNSTTVLPTIVNYIKLTNNATAARVTPTGDTITLKLSGNYFNSSFGATSNTLTCKYRFCEEGGTLGSYTTVTATKSGNTYSATLTVSGFNYQKNYTLEVVVSDKLMTITKTLTVLSGTPVFDWGKNDFNFNVPVSAPSAEIDGRTTSKSVQVRGDATGGVLFPSPLNANRYWWFFNYIVNGTDYSKMAFRSVNKIGDTSHYIDYMLKGLASDETGYRTYEILTERNTVDYLVEKGTSGIWTYEKYNSGFARCYGAQSDTVSCTTAWGSVYINSGGNTYANLPSGLFVGVSGESLTIDSVNASVTTVSQSTFHLTTGHTSAVQFIRGTSAANIPVTLYWEVRGRWK